MTFHGNMGLAWSLTSREDTCYSWTSGMGGVCKQEDWRTIPRTHIRNTCKKAGGYSSVVERFTSMLEIQHSIPAPTKYKLKF